MSIPVIAFFNNRGGVGKTSLVYHISWMMADMDLRIIAADLDPQGNLSTAFLDDDQLEGLWPETNKPPATVYGAIQPLQCGIGDISPPSLSLINAQLALIPGDMALYAFEDDLSQVWPKCLDKDERAFRVISAFWRVLQRGASDHQADVILVDLGPNLGAINRAALISSNHVVIPLGPDLFSLQGVRNLGPTLQTWRKGWSKRLKENPAPDLALPAGQMQPLGYVVMQHAVRHDRPVNAYEKWIARIPKTYRQYILGEKISGNTPSVATDPHCFALLKHYRSLIPMAQEARKPIFHLKPADGALGSHLSAARNAYHDFEKLTRKIATHARISLP